jgi:ABC-2 type transport system ATP-binding protein
VAVTTHPVRASAAAGVVLHGLEKSYSSPEGPVSAVAGVELSISAGETVALLGPNGAGKSTTIDMLLGLQAPDRGAVEVFGLPPVRAIAHGLIGAMLQSGGLIRDLSVLELLRMMAGLYPTPIAPEQAIATAGIGDISARRTQALSGGETQRVRFAMALVSNPDLLVLDEPSVGMDVEARHAFWLTVREYASRGKTVLFATHYLEEADRYADRVVLMAQGRIVADGPTTEIKAMVGSRTIRATVPGAETERLRVLPGVTQLERLGDAVTLVCSNSDLALRALLAECAEARDIEVVGAGLEEAFLHLTRPDQLEQGPRT